MAGSRERPGDLRRQEVLETGQPHGVRIDLDPRIEVLTLVERALEARVEVRVRAEFAGQRGVAFHHDEITVAAQLDVEIGEFERRATRLQVAVDDGRIVDDDASRRQAVEIEWRPIGRTLAQAQQPDATVGETHDRHARLEDADAARDELARAEEIPEVEADAAFARGKQRLRAVLGHHAQIAQHDFRPVPAQPRVEPRVLELHVRLAFDPRAQLLLVVRHVGDRNAQRRQQQRDHDKQSGRGACDQAPPPGGSHMSTTSYWSCR